MYGNRKDLPKDSSMKNLVSALSFCFLLFTSSLNGDDFAQSYIKAAEEPGAILFNPPEDWKVVDPKLLPKHVKAMIIGKGKSNFPPSINIGMEKWAGTVKEYLQRVVKPANDNAHCDWKDLGTIKTQAGEASLSQVDIESSWGSQRLMHVIIKKSDNLYVVTAAALKEEFPEFYKEFFTAMRSIRFNKDVFEMIPGTKRRNELKASIEKLLASWQKILDDSRSDDSGCTESIALKNEAFRKEYWEPFTEMLDRSFADMNDVWHKHVRNQVECDLAQKQKKS